MGKGFEIEPGQAAPVEISQEGRQESPESQIAAESLMQGGVQMSEALLNAMGAEAGKFQLADLAAAAGLEGSDLEGIEDVAKAEEMLKRKAAKERSADQASALSLGITVLRCGIAMKKLMEAKRTEEEEGRRVAAERGRELTPSEKAQRLKVYWNEHGSEVIGLFRNLFGLAQAVEKGK